MIEAISLHKRFGPVHAVRDASFRVETGEIAAFLGPNGAGKTTCMRILTGFLPATSGRATVAGCDIQRDARGVRQRLGYLPENVPLYRDMRVSEYLDFRARIKGVAGRERRARIEHVLDRCALTDMRQRLIGNLSKGYRQRVGLADALINDPPVLILDEPTVGLDPNQTAEVRRLIGELKVDRTVLLSTHILSEAEAISGKIIIINHGRILVQDSPEGLRRTIRTKRPIIMDVAGPASATADADALCAAVRGIDAVSAVSAQTTPDGVRLKIDVRSPGEATAAAGPDPRDALFALAVKSGWTVRELHRETLHLEDIFRELTTRDDHLEGQAREAADA